MRKMGPLEADHPSVGTQTCPGCGASFQVGDYVTLMPLGPGDDPEARAKARDGRPYNAVSLVLHWACVTGEEPKVKLTLTAELDNLLPTTKTWLVNKGYIIKNVNPEGVEYQWTQEGYQWINEITAPKTTP